MSQPTIKAGTRYRVCWIRPDGQQGSGAFFVTRREADRAVVRLARNFKSEFYVVVVGPCALHAEQKAGAGK